MRWLCGVAALGTLAGCVGRPAPDLAGPAPAVAPAVTPSAIAPTPINARLSAAATLWHLRTGLNVAALACPDAGVVPAYNALLAQRAEELARAEATYRSQYEAAGGDWRDRYDDDQTRLYNFWSQARGRSGLCAAAQNSLTVLAGTPDAALPEVAGTALRRLDQAFAPPWIAVDPRVLTGPGRVEIAAR
jgi:hypothetical protein